MAYLYRHIRLDTNEIFYIGIGSDVNYNRAYDKTQRTKHWKNIVSKGGYKVDILFDNISWETACRREIKLIKLCGRQDLGTGCLCNMTDGGEGNYGRITSQTTKDKIAISVKNNSHWKNGRGHTSKVIAQIIDASSKLVLNLQTGVFYSSVKEASYSINMRSNTLTRKLAGIRINNTHFILI